MPRAADEKDWQYARRMVGLAGRILDLVRSEEGSHPPVWRFSEVAARMDVCEEDVRAACRTISFTHDCHVRDEVFFLKSWEEKMDEVDWALGLGQYDQRMA